MTELTAPKWNMSTVFPSLTSDQFRAHFSSFLQAIVDANALWNLRGIRRSPSSEVDSSVAATYDEVTTTLNSILEMHTTLRSYVHCFVDTDASDEAAAAVESQIVAQSAELDKLIVKYTAWVGSLDGAALCELSPVAAAHRYSISNMEFRAKHLMSEAEEELAADLRPSGTAGWARLHGNLTALLEGRLQNAEPDELLSVTALRGLASNPDRKLRQTAFEAELAAWRTARVPLAAALNGIKGAQQVLRKRRGYGTDVEPTLKTNGIDAEVLHAMHSAVVEALPAFRRYMKMRATAFGIDKLAWYDLNAPLRSDGRKWTWPDACEFVAKQLGAFSPGAERFVRKAIDNAWIDAEMRHGKRGGAYCSRILSDQSRIMMNWDGSFTSVSTLAHELGHAYHNEMLRNAAPLQRETPMTLAETASIFFETAVFEAARREAGVSETITLLDTALNRDLMVVVDVYSRYLFEQGVFERRSERELTVTELADLMTCCQRTAYGPDLEPLHPDMWAVKGHYYGPLFYNYPYTFGLLFGIGLYKHYLAQPGGFEQRYNRLLASTGAAGARDLASEFGIDIGTVEFWRGSLETIGEHVDQLEALLAG